MSDIRPSYITGTAGTQRVQHIIHAIVVTIICWKQNQLFTNCEYAHLRSMSPRKFLNPIVLSTLCGNPFQLRKPKSSDLVQCR